MEDVDITEEDPYDIARPQNNFMKYIEEEVKCETTTVLGGTGGLVRSCKNMVLKMREEFELQNFPFDSQPINVTLRIKMPQLKQLQIFHTNTVEGDRQGAELHVPHINGWTFREDLCGEYLSNEPGQFPIKVFQIVFDRSISYYLAHLYWPLILLQILTFMVAAIDPTDSEGYPTVLNVILVQLLTLVAFRYSLENVLPTIPYYTLLDYYFFVAFLDSLVIALVDFSFARGWFNLDHRSLFYQIFFGAWCVFNVIYFIIAFRRKMNVQDCADQAWEVMKEYRSGPGGKVFLERQMILGKEKED